MKIHAVQNLPVEFGFKINAQRKEKLSALDVDVVFWASNGDKMTVPAYYAGDDEFRVRFAAPEKGKYVFSVVSGSKEKIVNGTIEVSAYDGANPLYKRGRLKVSANKKYLEHSDGTPFFWLGDTWWMGLCKRLLWPGEFQQLLQDRVKKGFSVVQIIAGLYPDMPAFDPRGKNEAGFPWSKDYKHLNPLYFEMADLRIERIVRAGIVPCIVGAWGYHLPWTGVDTMKKHWRNLIARYGAYPVVWCLAGEGAMAYYLSKDREKDTKFQKEGWTEIAAYVRKIDPYKNLITIHPTNNSRDQLEKPELIDFEMLQTGHGDRGSLPNHVNSVAKSVRRKPQMPSLVAEVCYEGIGEFCRQDVQRLMFWSAILNGTCGHTYGANGIWQLNRREKPYGPSPHGMSWGDTAWDEAMSLPGSTQLGVAKKLLEKYEWWKLEPHPEWIEPHWTDKDFSAPYCAGIPRKLRICYFPHMPWGQVKICKLEKGLIYWAKLFNPVNGTEKPLGKVRADKKGEWIVQKGWGTGAFFTFPLYQDWVLLMER